MENELLQQLVGVTFIKVVSSTGRDPARFLLDSRWDGRLRIQGPTGAAIYPAGNWIAPFSRHLQQGFFDDEADDAAAGDARPITARGE
jgi:hypothetical protein